MMKRFFFICFSFISFHVQAQLPEDALRMSYIRPLGTAREQAIGGAMGSIGGDLSSNYVNPAGLGFYKTSEIVLSPGWSFNSGKSSYLSNATNGLSANQFTLGTSGLVYGWSSEPGKSSAVSIAVTRSADFNGHITYQGNNNYSSGAEAYAEEFNNSGLTLDQAIAEPGISYGTRMALYTYLIDTSDGGQGPTIVQPLSVLNAGGQLHQQMDILTSGGITEIALGLAGVTKDKWYIGVSIGIPIVSYHQTLQYTESDLSGNSSNDFGSYVYSENYSSSGVGVNGKFGAIFRPNLNWRIGLAVHTPTFYSLTDKVSAAMTTNTEAYAGIRSVQSSELPQGDFGNSLQYNLQTPWHLLASGSYIFPGQVTQGKMGFITADIEYIPIKGAKFTLPTDENGNTVDNGYYDPLNSTIKSYYKNTFTFRMGGEYKLNDIAFRLGGSYTLNPYASSELTANRTTVGGGIGYRKKGVFIDLTYVEAITNDVNIPYRLSEKDNVFAMIKQYTGSLILTMGFKF